jgi:glycosyltransferase involved in cell wall biosynthesis
MRLGKSPTRYQKGDYRPARVTVCVLVCIPEQFGYFQHRFDVLKVCLNSIIGNTEPGTFDLLVFDNASCPEVVDYLRSLHSNRVIRYLLLSGENVGVANAYRIMFQGAPGEIIAYSDEDVLFRAGWLEAHLEILDTFPRVGMVSGSPAREQFGSSNRYLQAYLKEYPQISATSGRFVPEQWTEDHRLSTGRPAQRKEETEKERQRERELTEVALEYRGVRAYSTATHFQFVTPKAVVVQGLDEKWESRLMVGGKKLDERIDALGYARLTTIERYVRHMGNVVTEEFLDSVPHSEVSANVRPWRPPNGVALRLARTGIARAALSRLNNWSYGLLKYPT